MTQIKCLVTGHEMMPTVEEFNSHLQGKAYKRAVEGDIQLGQYAQYLVDNKKHNNFFFCKLTGMKVPKKRTAFDRHVNGKNFRKRLEQAKLDKAKGKSGKTPEDPEV